MAERPRTVFADARLLQHHVPTVAGNPAGRTPRDHRCGERRAPHGPSRRAASARYLSSRCPAGGGPTGPRSGAKWMLAGEQLSGVRGLLGLEHPCTGANRGTCGSATPRRGSDLHLIAVADPLELPGRVEGTHEGMISVHGDVHWGSDRSAVTLVVVSRTAHCSTKGSRGGGAAVACANSVFPCITRTTFLPVRTPCWLVGASTP
jgi:hypothetical protein